MHSVLQFVWVSYAATFFGFEIHYGSSEAFDVNIYSNLKERRKKKI